MPDQNDIVFDQYQIDFLAIFRAIFEAVGGSGITFDSIVDWLNSLWAIFVIFSFIIAALSLVGLIYAYIRNNQMGDLEAEAIASQEKLWQELHKGDRGNTRWADIESHINTDNPNDWKLAIIEADIILGEMLKEVGYAGTTIGEQLKSASPKNFASLDDAWTAHRVRNQIAHEGADFVLTKRLAQETLTQYRRVFQEFGVI